MNDKNTTKNLRAEKSNRFKIDDITDLSDNIKNENTNIKKITGSPYAKNIVVNNPNKGVAYTNGQVGNNLGSNKNPSLFNNSPCLNKNDKMKNFSAINNEKSKDLFTNNLNNIFNSFSNSSIISNITFKQNSGQNLTKVKKIDNLIENSKSNDNNSPSSTRRKADLVSNVTNYYSKERKASPLKFNALFNSSLVGVQPSSGNNFEAKKNEENINNSNNSKPKPITNAVENKILNNSGYYSVKEYSYQEDKNIRYRNAMEDFGKIIDMYMNDKNRGFFSLYDGHGGSDPVKYALERMPEILAKIIEKNDNIEEALVTAFHKLDEELKLTDSENTGSTACIILILNEYGNRYAYCANVGDSKSVLVSQFDTIKLSHDHKCSDPAEVERVKQSGGLVFSGRVFGQLVLTRALGDHALKKYGVIATPHVKKVQIEEKHKYIIIASDGIWDVINEDDIFKLSISIQTADEFAKLLVKTAINNGSKDNISCIVIKLN